MHYVYIHPTDQSIQLNFIIFFLKVKKHKRTNLIYRMIREFQKLKSPGIMIVHKFNKHMFKSTQIAVYQNQISVQDSTTRFLKQIPDPDRATGSHSMILTVLQSRSLNHATTFLFPLNKITVLIQNFVQGKIMNLLVFHQHMLLYQGKWVKMLTVTFNIKEIKVI